MSSHSPLSITPGDTALPADGLPLPRRYLAMFAQLTAISMAVLDGGIMNIALPSLADQFGSSPSHTIWIVTAYQLALVGALFPLAALAESLGYRRMFIFGIVTFMLASLMCALSPGLSWLVAARLFQGLGAAAVMCVSAGLVRHMYPLAQLGRGIGFNALCSALCSALGPTLGASILAFSDWPLLFLINLPLGVAVLMSCRALPEVPGVRRRVDALSSGLNALMFGLIVIAVDRLQEGFWLPLLLVAVAAVCGLWLVRRELPNTTPLIPLDLLRSPTFRQSVIVSICIFTAQMMTFIALPFYLQHQLGFNALYTGLLLTPWSLAVACAAQLAGRMANRHSPSLLCAGGAAVMALALICAGLWPAQYALWPLLLCMIVGGAGFGFFQVPNNRTMLLSAPVARSGAAGGMQATARQFGMAVGAALMALLFSGAPSYAARLGLGIGGLFAIAACLASLRNERYARLARAAATVSYHSER
ncbi:MFS transporter [Herbaspirillum sp. RTI4]|uniref:MFS transporter n=1 Tax=Herbaspirillum sp. RTI4 TaxID=3048640 RepID=UPI002AB4E4BD|nr:MFS transporter [Herbaspirillum sp. RTI4]MDY7577834.1 MFS transporter [Herbaspirillum sp. RTI4]MEA9982452.1 MFS transporter [Herbaspirillum sp. RTI4]